jgi:hypothetical protein
MDYGSERLVLNAALDKILEEKFNEEDLKDIVRILKTYGLQSDAARLEFQKRKGSEALLERMDFLNLENVGKYNVSREKRKETIIIIFSKDNKSIKFHLRRKEYDLSLQYREVEKLMTRVGGQEKIRLTGAMVKSIRNKTGPASEQILGKDSQSIDCYWLEKVELVTPTRLLGFIPFNVSKIIFQGEIF